MYQSIELDEIYRLMIKYIEKKVGEYVLLQTILMKTACFTPFIHRMIVFFLKLHGSNLHYISIYRSSLDLLFDDKIYRKKSGRVCVGPVKIGEDCML